MSDNEPDWDAISTGLSAPFPAEQIKQLPGRGGKTYDYVDARDVMNRLDAIVGTAHWSDAYHVLDTESKAVECTLTIHGVSKSDVGYPNSASDAENDAREPYKASYSDSLKRAAVKWGIGRHLYEHGGATPSTATATQPTRNAARVVEETPTATSDQRSDERTKALVAMGENINALMDAGGKSRKEVLRQICNKLGITAGSTGELATEQIAAIAAEADRQHKTLAAARPEGVAP